jgi:hypothetical protein
MDKQYTRSYHGKSIRRLPGGGLVITKHLGPKQARVVHHPKQRTGPTSGGCFPAQTRVLTPSGWRAISTIEVGDKVMSTSEGCNVLVPRLVTAVKRHGTADLLAIRTSAGKDPLLVTPSHALLTEGGAWRRAGQLKAGDKVVVRGQVQERVTEISSIVDAGQAAEVFNLHTEQEHNFIVDGGKGCGLVAHNFGYLRAFRVLMHRVFLDSAIPSTQLTAA